MLKIGLTGGIGSGKTTVARIFNTLGVPVFDADSAAKSIMNENPSLRSAIKENFGADIYENDVLNRKKLASVVFNNKEKLSQLNALVHPVTIAAAEKWIQEQSAPYIIKEAALLFEAGADAMLNYVIGVSAPKELRIKRVMLRDNVFRKEVLARLNKQMEEPAKMRLCDFVITNDEQQLLVAQILAIHRQLETMVN